VISLAIHCRAIFVKAPCFREFFGTSGVPMTLSVAAFKVDFYEECISGIFNSNENGT
jgi:hypothetical protein